MFPFLIDPTTGLPMAPTKYPALDYARGAWQAARLRLDALHPTDDERRALTPALRRAAMLKAIDPQSTDWHPLTLVPIGALFFGVPALVTWLSGSGLGAGHLIVAYALYLPCLLAGLVAVFMVVLALVQVSEDRPSWVLYSATLVAASATTAGMAAFWLSLDNASPTILLSLFSALVVALGTALVFAADTPLAEARKRRDLGMLGVDHTAALLVMEEWETLAAHRRDWRTPAQRQKLPKALSRLAASTQSRLDRSVRANGGQAADRGWAADLAWYLARTIGQDRARLLRIDCPRQYTDLVGEVRQRMAALCRGDWSAVQRPSEAAPNTGWARRVARFGVPVVLVGAAVGVGFLPSLHISPDTLFTVRLSLVVPAVLSLLPVKPGSQDTLMSAMRDTLGFLKS